MSPEKQRIAKPKPRKEKWKTGKYYDVHFQWFDEQLRVWNADTQDFKSRRAANRWIGVINKNTTYRSIQIFEVETRKRRVK